MAIRENCNRLPTFQKKYVYLIHLNILLKSFGFNSKNGFYFDVLLYPRYVPFSNYVAILIKIVWN